MEIKNMRFLLFGLLLPGLCGCFNSVSIPQQVTSFYADCDAKDVQIEDDVEALNGEQTWTARCNNKTYTCSHFPEVDSNCYEVNK